MIPFPPVSRQKNYPSYQPPRERKEFIYASPKRFNRKGRKEEEKVSLNLDTPSIYSDILSCYKLVDAVHENACFCRIAGGNSTNFEYYPFFRGTTAIPSNP